MEKLKNRTCDEIDEIMITSRVQKALQELFPVVSEFSKKIESLCEEYSDELRLAGFGIVMGVTEITDGDDVGLRIVYGSKRAVYKVYDSLTKEINK